jgi:hypothetical protein
MEDKNTIPFETSEGEQVMFQVLEQTTIAGQNYLLVVEPEEDDVVYIMKEVAASDGADMVTYEFVEEEQELTSISKVFEELLEDTDIIE